jgi:glycosyltransferase involved in cell wall biosynthesis
MSRSRPRPINDSRRIAIFLPSLAGGGAERIMCNLAVALAERGIRADLVLANKAGPYLRDVPPSVRIVDLASDRVIASIPGLVRYLRREKPHSVISALSHANLAAAISHLLARSRARLVVSERIAFVQTQAHSKVARTWLFPFLIPLLYGRADQIVAVSQGVADQLVDVLGLPRDKVAVIYNPVVGEKLLRNAEEPLDHPWFVPQAPPVVLAAGRLVAQKDFQTLIRAFALVRNSRPARLMILGEGKERSMLERLARRLKIADDVNLPGFVDNPYKYMSRAGVFASSSLFEGFCNVIVEAMACGTPVISTDCPSGPTEILEHGRWGRLVAVGDADGLAQAINDVLDEPSHPDVRSRAAMFSVEKTADAYLDLAMGSLRHPASLGRNES